MLKTRFLRYGLGLSLTILFLLHSSQHFPLPIIQTLENMAYDFRLKLTLPKSVDKKVIIIDIDEKSLNEIGQWPWDRNILAQIVDNLFDYYQVKVLGFDIFFAEKDENPSDKILHKMASSSLGNNPEFQAIYANSLSSMHRDQRLAQSLENRNVVLGMVLYENKTLNKGQLPKSIPQFTPEIINSFSFKHAASYTANLPILQSSARTAGYIDNPLLDDDGVFRKVPLLQAYNNKIYPSLALAIARASMENNQIKLGFEIINEQTSQRSLEWLYIGEIAIPVDENAGALVPYIGSQKSFQYISAVDVLKKTAPKNAMTNMITIFGTSAAGLLDLRTTPLGKAYPGVEVHANIVQGILDKTIKHRPEYIIGFEILLLIILGLSLTFLLPVLSPVWSSLCMVSAMAISLGIDSYAWNSLQIVLPIASPILLILLLYGMNMSYGFFVESRGKRHLTHLFGQYVPPELVVEMSR
ncbi:MAG: CHASE2 domain-containing protein, partial [Gammaproteobacteria bacterium]|nr:CHASE2 domain-containing protein [Gammaproteobacteria bacterium]